MDVAGVVVYFTVSPSEGGSVAVINTSNIYIYIYIYIDGCHSVVVVDVYIRESKGAGADQDVTGAA